MKTTAEPVPVRTLQASVETPVLAVDLDGTLVKTDLLLESLVALLKQEPWCIFLLPLWLLKGRAYLKQQVARRVSLDVDVLPYREELLDYLKTQRAQGRNLVLATASDMQIARKIADHLRLFDLILASDGTTNLRGEHKRDRLVNEFGKQGFDYAGNDRHDDEVVWASARNTIVARSRGWKKSLADRLNAFRPQHWLKNILIFAPLLAAHRFYELALSGKALLAFVAFGCIASAGYLINDLLDLPADRHHPSKRLRPFAAGDLPISYALRMIPALLGLGCLAGAFVSPLFLGVLSIYLALSLIYSFHVKKVVVLDVILLAGLYTMRILAGSAAVGIRPSHWLLAFSTFLFFSLALVKRYGELAVMRRIDGDRATARGYETTDGELLAAMGIASGYLSVLVLALYISSDTAHVLYGRYEMIWFLCPLLLYWISHVWLIAHRGRVPDDPVVFATNDRTSRVLILLMLAITVWAL